MVPTNRIQISLLAVLFQTYLIPIASFLTNGNQPIRTYSRIVHNDASSQTSPRSFLPPLYEKSDPSPTVFNSDTTTWNRKSFLAVWMGLTATTSVLLPANALESTLLTALSPQEEEALLNSFGNDLSSSSTLEPKSKETASNREWIPGGGEGERDGSQPTNPSEGSSSSSRGFRDQEQGPNLDQVLFQEGKGKKRVINPMTHG